MLPDRADRPAIHGTRSGTFRIIDAMPSSIPLEQWQQLVAVGLVAGDLSAQAISRYALVSTADAQRALDRAEAAGVLVDGALVASHEASLLAELPDDVAAEVHARIARHLIAQGPTRLIAALGHARAAGGEVEIEEICELADQAGRTSLSIGDYQSAHQLFALADEAGADEPTDVKAERLGEQARALEGLGLVREARDVLARAFDLADLAGATELAADLAVAYAFPADWYAGDVRASAFLQRAAAMRPDPERLTRITAARAVVDMRIPIPTSADQQLAWVTRASIAQPDAEAALEASTGCSLDTRLLALLAWRTTHRAPRHLSVRREVSIEALDLAHRLRLPGRQVDAAVMLAVDSLESADRPQFDRALSVLRWVAERDGNPRLIWHASTAAAGIAFMDSDLDTAVRFRTRAREAGMAINSPGWFGADMLFLAQELIATGDLAAVKAVLPPGDDPVLSNPIARAQIAHFRAMLGEHEVAERHLRIAMRQVDEEASMLLLCSRIAATAVELGLHDLMADLTVLLTPYAHHVTVDSNVWWCDGPVSATLAFLAHAQGDDVAAVSHLMNATATARSMGDARSLARLATLRTSLDPGLVQGHAAATSESHGLSERELQVLRMIVAGATNPQIARTLSYSPSTIRNDATAIYRKLGVRTRPEAAARAIALGLA